MHVALVLACILGLAAGPIGTRASDFVVRVGQGAARLTLSTDGLGKLYVNLKNLTPGVWNEHLWSGTCQALGTRVAVLPGLRVPASGRLARTNSLTAAQATGRTLRIVHGTEVLCATFGTIVPPVASVVLVGAGDIAGCGFSADSATAELIDAIPGTVFTVGDNVYPDGTADQFANCYEPSWGRFKSRTRPVPGNHDYNTPNATGYFGYFGAIAGAPSEGWYAYDVGAWRIYVLNSNCGAVGGCESGTPQERWLSADLAANPRTCVAASWHHPRFTSGPHGNDPRLSAFWQALYTARAELVISGHDHDYERFAPLGPDGNPDPAGVREIVSGTGGVGHTSFVTTQPGSEIRDDATFGVLKLTLREASYTWEFIPIAGQTFTDSGTTSCH